MKKIINGKVYDSEKAKFLVSLSFGLPGYSSYCKESLYQKRTGEFFIFVEGGPMAKYSRIIDNNSCVCGKQIVSLSYEAAQQWAEDNLPEEEYEYIFGSIAEDDTKILVHLHLSATSVAKLKRGAAQSGVSMSEFADEHFSKL